MEQIFDEKMIRDELRKLDKKTGLHGADLPIKFGKAISYLGFFSHKPNNPIHFYFSTAYFENPNFAVEEKLDVIRHEYAHYMDFILHGTSSHGQKWKECCRIVGAAPQRCYNADRNRWYLSQHKKQLEKDEKYKRFQVGQKIIHPTFGSGVITEITENCGEKFAVVSFDDGCRKKLSLSWIDTHCKKN